MEQKLDIIINELQGLNKRVSTMERNMAMKWDLKAVEEKLTVNINNVEGKLTTNINSVEEKLTANISNMEGKLTANISNVEEKLTANINSVEEKLTANMNSVEEKLDQLTKNVDEYHIENITADNLLLNEIRTLRENVVFVNRRIADTELELNTLRRNKS